ncbi:Glu-tRNA(Gln) amidotransferase subunit GatD [Candidatus Thorarchaeota archaeon]|nr:MAG: Glu-tRNA(Gln) amidotransferase subunit GatD [Candidatus Thorarchaeota archaeon]
MSKSHCNRLDISEAYDMSGLESSGYHGIVLKKLQQAKTRVGDTIRVVTDSRDVTGILMPRAQIGSDPKHIVVKLDSGYNMGIKIDEDAAIQRIKAAKKTRRRAEVELKTKKDLPTVSILSTGGTIASKVDYQTGAVNPALSAQDLHDSVPELGEHANVRARVIMSRLSENIYPSDWSKITRAVAKEIRSGTDGVVIAHGTDTLAFTAAALSFSLQSLPVPVVLVGSQRSSDRPSSDAALNLTAAIDLAGNTDAAEVMIVMHGQTDDKHLLAHRGTRARKCHSSRRDAFRSINSSPLYRIEPPQITELTSPLSRRDKKRKLRVKPRFEEKVALLKTYPGIQPDLIKNIISTGHKGLILEGSGLGHTPKTLYPAIQSATDEGLIVGMTSQCVWGRVNMDVYRSGVELLEMGVIPLEDMLAETALVKLMWLLANYKSTERVRELMTLPQVGEIEMRTEMHHYPSPQGGI